MKTTIGTWLVLAAGAPLVGTWAEVPIPAPGSGTAMLTQMLADPDALPAINGCIAAHPGAFGGTWVEEIMPSANGQVKVETNDLDGRRRVCTAELRTGRVIRSVLEGEVPTRVYVPRTTLRGETPSGPCFTAFPVVVNRQLHGWRLERELSNRCNTPDWLTPLKPKPQMPPVVQMPPAMTTTPTTVIPAHVPPAGVASVTVPVAPQDANPASAYPDE